MSGAATAIRFRRFNVAPTTTVPILRMSGRSREVELAAARWGFVPHWWKEAKPPKTSFNARLEEAASKPMWRDALRRSRCLIPAEGWYEWQNASALIRRPAKCRRSSSRSSSRFSAQSQC